MNNPKLRIVSDTRARARKAAVSARAAKLQLASAQTWLRKYDKYADVSTAGYWAGNAKIKLLEARRSIDEALNELGGLE
jgi:hypothetical protein